jgi:hypothetical protein
MKNDIYILSTAIKRKNGRKIKKGRKGSRIIELGGGREWRRNVKER